MNSTDKLELTQAQVEHYRKEGYLVGLPSIYEKQEIPDLMFGYNELIKLLNDNEDPRYIREWHETSTWLYDVCTHPKILDLVEGLLGSDIFLWGSNFFCKAPYSAETVGWHQDAYYWDLKPHNTVTVWLAFTDVDEQNGAMQVIPRSHQGGILQHTNQNDKNSVLHLFLEKGTFNVADAVSLKLKAGQISIHDDNLIHGSPANVSDRWRIGLTMRFSSTNVKFTGDWNSSFRSYMVRGQDTYKHNRQGDLPKTKFGRRAEPQKDRKEVRPLEEVVV